MQQIKIGIREAKINLSKLIKDAQMGREVIITDRRKPVVKIIPVPEDSLSLEERIKSLERVGWIEPLNKKRIRNLPPPLPLPDEYAQKFLQEDRNS